MNSYFDQRWEQYLADSPEALRLFGELSAEKQQQIVNYIEASSSTRDAERRIGRMLGSLLDTGDVPEGIGE